MLTFEAVNDATHAAAIEAMMRGLYAEDPSSYPVDPGGFRRTIEQFLHNAAAGSIVLFLDAGQPVGYAILIPYWSNEFGGRLVFVDELYVMPASRGRGIATAFFAHLRATRPFDAVGLALEVTPANARAAKLYTALGFQPRKNAVYICSW